MPLDVLGLIGQWMGNRNIASAKGKRLGAFIYMRYAIREDAIAILHRGIGLAEFIGEKK